MKRPKCFPCAPDTFTQGHVGQPLPAIAPAHAKLPPPREGELVAHLEERLHQAPRCTVQDEIVFERLQFAANGNCAQAGFQGFRIERNANERRAYASKAMKIDRTQFLETLELLVINAGSTQDFRIIAGQPCSYMTEEHESQIGVVKLQHHCPPGAP